MLLKTKEAVLNHIKSRGFDPNEFDIRFNGHGPTKMYDLAMSANVGKENEKFVITSMRDHIKEDVLDHELAHANFRKKHPMAGITFDIVRFPLYLSNMLGSVGTTSYVMGVGFASLVINPYIFLLEMPAIAWALEEGMTDFSACRMRKKAERSKY